MAEAEGRGDHLTVAMLAVPFFEGLCIMTAGRMNQLWAEKETASVTCSADGLR